MHSPISWIASFGAVAVGGHTLPGALAMLSAALGIELWLAASRMKKPE